MAIETFFSGGRIARQGELRIDEAHLEGAWNSADTRFIAIWNSRCLVRNNAAAFLTKEELGTDWHPASGIYLGQLDGRELFAVQLPDRLGSGGPGEEAFENFRGLLGDLPADDASLLAYAKGMIEWHSRHRFLRPLRHSEHLAGGRLRARLFKRVVQDALLPSTRPRDYCTGHGF